jgi:hypothetical protein
MQRRNPRDFQEMFRQKWLKHQPYLNPKALPQRPNEYLLLQVAQILIHLDYQ